MVQRSEERHREEHGGKDIEREGNFKICTLMRTLTNIQYTLHKTTHNATLDLDTLLLEMKIVSCIVMRRSVLFDRWMKSFYVMAIKDCVHMTWTWYIIRNPGESG